ncbi:MAG: phosphoglycerate mutase family protein [Planctomycetota bacterium]
MEESHQISRRGIVGTAAALVCGVGLASAQEPASPTKPPPAEPAPSGLRTVILVRHAEKAADDPRDPSLSEVGKLRVAALMRLLGETRVTHVWTSEYKRAKETAAPVVLKHRLVPVEVPGRDPTALATRVKELPAGSISLIVGHSNTLPTVAKALGVPLTNLGGGTDLKDDEYDRFVVITLGGEKEPGALLEMRYGP